MQKRKADVLSSASSVKNTKKLKQDLIVTASTMKNSNPLMDSDSNSGSEDDSEEGGAPLNEQSFKINEGFAKRFEHNKKREELHRLEEKYQKTPQPPKDQYGGKYDEDEDTSSDEDEDEDDEGFLATEALDAEISATLQAIRNKDPRVYDEKITFYAPIEEDDGSAVPKKERPMYLRDYHRENLLNGYTGADETGEVLPLRTFAQEQDDLKKTVVKEMQAAADGDTSSQDGEDGGFLVPKGKPHASKQAIHPSRVAKVAVDVKIAEKDPETFLSNFMAARAWVPGDGARFQPLESDDDEEEERAEKFEAAYNLRFEDPTGSNEVLRSYARDIVAAKSVRREEPKSRKKQRDVEREKREEEKRQREQDRARLRKLKIEELEQKLEKVKTAAGLKGKTLKDGEWMKFLDEGWDEANWEAEMGERFGDEYYAEEEAGIGQDGEDDDSAGPKKKNKVKKPKWDNDIDIKDIIPEFEAEEELSKKPSFTSSDSDSDGEHERGLTSKKSKSSKERLQEKITKKKAAKVERKKIEALVDHQLDTDGILQPKASQRPSQFRYRETSPTSFGLTARDILMAPDASLNQFAGLKKMATFRDSEKKRKDKRRLGKKARLRQWRRETFGNEEGPEIMLGASATAAAAEANYVDAPGGDTTDSPRKKRKRTKKNKGAVAVVG